MKFNALLVSAAMMVMTLAACGDDDPVNPDNNQGGNEDTETVEGDVEGTWKANSIILVSGHITVPAGKSLTIEEGVQVIFDDKGVGANHVPVEFTVDGNLYCKGTAENPANGVYTAGDDAYPQITTNNIKGKYVITNSVLRNGWSDGIYLMGGQAIIAGNTFAANGYDGAEAVNVKAGCTVDVAGNIMFSPNTRIETVQFRPERNARPG